MSDTKMTKEELYEKLCTANDTIHRLEAALVRDEQNRQWEAHGTPSPLLNALQESIRVTCGVPDVTPYTTHIAELESRLASIKRLVDAAMVTGDYAYTIQFLHTDLKHIKS